MPAPATLEPGLRDALAALHARVAAASPETRAGEYALATAALVELVHGARLEIRALTRWVLAGERLLIPGSSSIVADAIDRFDATHGARL